MIRSLVPISALLLSVAFLLLGHGLLLTLLPIKASLLGFTSLQIALTGSAYFLGFVSGCLLTPHILKRVGHVRGFAVSASIYLIVALLFSSFQTFAIWFLLRFCIGASVSGLYMIIESWLNNSADSSNRGSILSFYSMLSLLMITLAQQLLNLGESNYQTLFMIAAIFVALAIIPVSLTVALQPAPVQNVKVSFKKIWQHSHIATIGTIVVGLITGSFWSLAPVYAAQSGFDNTQLALFMSATVMGGAFLQIPLGRFSDKYDRRIVLQFNAIFGSVISLAIVFASSWSGFVGWPAAVLTFFWGSVCMTSYALCIAHVNDNAKPDDFLVIGSGMLITYGLASALGGPIASLVMSAIGAEGLYAFMSLILALFAIIIFVRRNKHILPATAVENTSFQASAGLTTTAALEIDPRAKHSDVEEDFVGNNIDKTKTIK